jgi:hypothetical protein
MAMDEKEDVREHLEEAENTDDKDNMLEEKRMTVSSYFRLI